eukprot:Tamp_32526.p1 GENE.Tamp_32526~~Tamp_32526.p1  ORF type:complete len:138 (-),score=22.53 Tamp_32526:38-451(-)
MESKKSYPHTFGGKQLKLKTKNTQTHSNKNFEIKNNKLPVAEIRGAAAENGVPVMVVDSEHRRPNLRISVPMAIRVGLLDADRENWVSLTSLFVLARYSDVFLGCFSSGYTRLVMEFAAATRGVVLPHVSMDVAWAF